MAALQLEGTDLAQLMAAAKPVPRRRRLTGSATETTTTPRHKLPIPSTRLILRSGELGEIQARLRAGRLVTL